MLLGILATVLLGALAFWWGMRIGQLLLKQGATANDLFKGKASFSLLFLGLYFLFILLALNIPQAQAFPIELRIYGMRITWTILRVTLLGMCGVAFTVSWHTARLQILAVLLVGGLGLSGFFAAENYFLSPIYTTLQDNLQPNGVFQQTSASSCAPSALATILRRWGLPATESEVARLAGTSRLGTSMPQLIEAARALAMDGLELSPTWEQMQRINRPGVLATWLFYLHGKAAHATALIALDDTTATIADPAFGKIYQVNRQQFDRLWRRQYVPIFRPADLTVTPTEVASYLHQLGFLPNSSDGLPSPSRLEAAIQQFQQVIGVKATGELTPETVLLLTGPFLRGVPTLQ